MESSLWPAILFAVLLLALLAVIVLLAWLQQRQATQQAAQTQSTLTLVSKMGETQSTALRDLTTLLLQQISSELSASQSEMLQHLETQTKAVMTTLATTVNQSTSSLGSTTNRLSELVASSQTMLASKDSIAYQTMRGSDHSFDSDPGTEPYTSTEELSLYDAQRAEQARMAEGLIARIQNLAGVNNGSFPAAGDDLRPAAPAE